MRPPGIVVFHNVHPLLYESFKNSTDVTAHSIHNVALALALAQPAFHCQSHTVAFIWIAD